MQIPLAKPTLNGKAEELILKCVRSSWISSQAPAVREFEERMADWLRVKHAISTSNGTAALHLAIASLRLGWNKEVLVPSYTFVASANAVVYCKLRPTFCDVEAHTWCISTSDMEKRITPDTVAVIPVHINGYPCDMGPIMDLARKRKILVVEDACQALGGKSRGKYLGTIGDIGCFSFFANKILTTGEGGMCVTNNDDLAHRMRILRDHGKKPGMLYDHEVIGFNYRMTALQASIGLSQIDGLSEEVERRHFVMNLYRLAGITNTQPSSSWQSPWMFQLKLPSQQEATKALEALSKAGIESRNFFRPIHNQAIYKWRRPSSLPITESMFGVMLPIHSGIDTEAVGYISKTLKDAKIPCTPGIT